MSSEAFSTPTDFTLHFFPFSLYSLMVRLGVNIGKSLDIETAPRIQFKLVNLHRDDNLSEEYLTRISSKGQVPCLTGPSLENPLTESRTISDWLVGQQPGLKPAEHKAVIEDLIEKLYSFHAKALTVPPEDRKFGIPNKAAEKLEKESLSDNHRRALEIKSVFQDSLQGNALEPDNVTKTEVAAQSFIQGLDEALSGKAEHSGPWIFGSYPTILDGHAVPIIARLIDVKRDDLLTERVRAYAEGAKMTQQWEETTHGRATIWNVGYGHVELMNPL